MKNMEAPYRVEFDGILEGFAVIYVRPDLAKITEDENKEHTFYIDPAPIKDALWEALFAKEKQAKKILNRLMRNQRFK